MNLCSFTGYLTENPRSELVGDVLRVEFVMVIYTYRTTRNGEKNRIPTYLTFEAWHTGAETLEKFATRGTKLSVHASAKNPSKENRSTLFRINEFDFCDDHEGDE